MLRLGYSRSQEKKKSLKVKTRKNRAQRLSTRNMIKQADANIAINPATTSLSVSNSSQTKRQQNQTVPQTKRKRRHFLHWLLTHMRKRPASRRFSLLPEALNLIYAIKLYPQLHLRCQEHLQLLLRCQEYLRLHLRCQEYRQ